MSAWAKPGVKCVCIDNWHETHNAYSRLVVGRVYTIAEVAATAHPGLHQVGRYAGSAAVLKLQEVNNQFSGRGVFAIDRFRPLAYPSQSLEADLAKFKQVGTHVRAPEKERA